MIVGFIGLGNLGSAMVRRLASEGVRVRAWNRTRRKAEHLPVELEKTPAVLVTSVEVLFLNLFDSDAVEEVLTMPGGVLQGTCCDKIIVDTTTNHPARVLRFHDFFRAQGGTYLEAPVLGSVVPALKGALTMLVSGEQHGLNGAMPFIEKLCKAIYQLPEPGTATRMKLINNLVLASLMATLADAVALGERAGIARATALDILGSGAGESAVLAAKREKLRQEDFSPQFSVKAILKDLRYLGYLLGALGTTSVLQRPLEELYGRAAGEGLGDLDLSAVLRLMNLPAAQRKTS